MNRSFANEIHQLEVQCNLIQKALPALKSACANGDTQIDDIRGIFQQYGLVDLL